MKVKELIELLKTLNPDSEVLIEAWQEKYIQYEHCFRPKIVELDDRYYDVNEDTGDLIIYGYLDDDDEDKITYYDRDWFYNKNKEKNTVDRNKQNE